MSTEGDANVQYVNMDGNPRGYVPPQPAAAYAPPGHAPAPAAYYGYAAPQSAPYGYYPQQNVPYAQNMPYAQNVPYAPQNVMYAPVAPAPASPVLPRITMLISVVLVIIIISCLASQGWFEGNSTGSSKTKYNVKFGLFRSCYSGTREKCDDTCGTNDAGEICSLIASLKALLFASMFFYVGNTVIYFMVARYASQGVSSRGLRGLAVLLSVCAFLALSISVGLAAGLRADLDSLYSIINVDVEFQYCFFLTAGAAALSFFVSIYSCAMACCFPG